MRNFCSILNHSKLTASRSCTKIRPNYYCYHYYNCCFTFSTNTTRPFDPTARKPNQKCDPYGQQGKPLSYEEASFQLQSLDKGWMLISRDYDDNYNDDNDDDDKGIQATNHHHPQNQHMTNEDLLKPKEPTVVHLPPKSLRKRFTHSDYLNAAKFASILSAVAHNNHHYPTITIQRRLLQKSWEVNTIVTCHTQVLNGLSYHDFYIAMMLDVEVHREEVARLLMESKES